MVDLEKRPEKEDLNRDLIDCLAIDPSIIEYGLRLRQKEYNTGNFGYIDLLCIDRNRNHVVVETKKGGGNEKVVDRIRQYMGWIEENLAKSGEGVRGIIIVNEFDGRLNSTLSDNDNIQLKYYEPKFET